MLWPAFVVAMFAGVAIHLKLDRQPRTAYRVVTLFLLYLLVLFAGVGGLLAAMGHTFYAAQVARASVGRRGAPSNLRSP